MKNQKAPWRLEGKAAVKYTTILRRYLKNPSLKNKKELLKYDVTRK